MKYVLAEGVVLQEAINRGDVFDITRRYARTKKMKDFWELRPNMLVETADTRLEIIDIEIGQIKVESAEPGVGCRLVLHGLDNIRANDVLGILHIPTEAKGDAETLKGSGDCRNEEAK